MAFSPALTGSILRKRWLKTPHSWLISSAILTLKWIFNLKSLVFYLFFLISYFISSVCKHKQKALIKCTLLGLGRNFSFLLNITYYICCSRLDSFALIFLISSSFSFNLICWNITSFILGGISTKTRSFFDVNPMGSSSL